MGYSRRLAITELAPGQVQAYLVVNDGVSALEDSTNRQYIIDMAADDVFLSELETVRYYLYIPEGAPAHRTLTFPSMIGANITDRVLTVQNRNPFLLTLSSADGMSTYDLPPGRFAFVKILENELTVFELAGSTFSVGMFFPDQLPLFIDNPPEVMMQYVFTERVVFPAGFAGSFGVVGTPPDAPVMFTVLQNGSEVGRFVIDTDGDFFAANDGELIFEPGDVMTVTYELLLATLFSFVNVPNTTGPNPALEFDDGVASPVTFTFGVGGGQVNPGLNVQTSRNNLMTAINNDGTLGLTMFPKGTDSILFVFHETVGADITVVARPDHFSFNPAVANTDAEDVSLTILGHR